MCFINMNGPQFSDGKTRPLMTLCSCQTIWSYQDVGRCYLKSGRRMSLWISQSQGHSPWAGWAEVVFRLSSSCTCWRHWRISALLFSTRMGAGTRWMLHDSHIFLLWDLPQPTSNFHLIGSYELQGLVQGQLVSSWVEAMSNSSDRESSCPVVLHGDRMMEIMSSTPVPWFQARLWAKTP